MCNLNLSINTAFQLPNGLFLVFRSKIRAKPI